MDWSVAGECTWLVIRTYELNLFFKNHSWSSWILFCICKLLWLLSQDHNDMCPIWFWACQIAELSRLALRALLFLPPLLPMWEGGNSAPAEQNLTYCSWEWIVIFSVAIEYYFRVVLLLYFTLTHTSGWRPFVWHPPVDVAKFVKPCCCKDASQHHRLSFSR